VLEFAGDDSVHIWKKAAMKLTAYEKALFLRLVSLMPDPEKSTGEAMKCGIADMALEICPRGSRDYAPAIDLMLKIHTAPPPLFDEIAAGFFEVIELNSDEFEVAAA
jgi:hypothetical protein